MRKINKILFVVFLVAGSLSAQAAESDITVHTIYIPGLLTHKHTGPFAALIKEIGRRAGMHIGIEILPPMRQRVLFENKRIDIIFPMVASSFHEGTAYARSSSFYKKKYCAFTRRGETFVRSEADLLKLQGPIGLTHGYSYPRQLLDISGLDFDYAPSDEQNMKKLSLGRIASFIVEENSGINALHNTHLEGVITYDAARPLFTEDVFFAFQKKETLLPVKEAISHAIEEMNTDGSLKGILKGLDPADEPKIPVSGKPGDEVQKWE